MLLARLAGGFQAPLVKAAGLFQAFTRNFAYGLKAYIDIAVPKASRGPPSPAPAGSDEGESDQCRVKRSGSSRDRPRRSRRPETEPETAEAQTEDTTGEAN